MFVCQRYSLECAAPDIKGASLVPEPGPAAACTRRVADCIATKCGRAGPREQHNSLTRAEGCLESNFKIGGYKDFRVRIASLKKRSRAARHAGAPGTTEASADPLNMASMNFVAPKHGVRSFARRNPRLRVARADGIWRPGRGTPEDPALGVRKNANGLPFPAIESKEVRSF